MSSGDHGGRTLDRTLSVDWDSPPSSLLDVDVVVVYEDGTVESVDDRNLELVQEGVVVEGHPLDPGRRVLQVRVDWNETIPFIPRLVGFFREMGEDLQRRYDRQRGK
jgi:hypothetical protein